VSYGELLRIFFSVAHDPTELNRQGPDVGTQYRSGIYVVTPEQRQAAEASKAGYAKALAGRLRFELNDASTGGASDANTTAGLGVPTLDGLGPIGGNDHSPEEYLEVDSIVPRTTLLAGLLLAVGRDPVVGSWRPHRA